jgi:hypothetical protein
VYVSFIEPPKRERTVRLGAVLRISRPTPFARTGVRRVLGYGRYWPAFTANHWPVTGRARSDARKMTEPVISAESGR